MNVSLIEMSKNTRVSLLLDTFQMLSRCVWVVQSADCPHSFIVYGQGHRYWGVWAGAFLNTGKIRANYCMIW